MDIATPRQLELKMRPRTFSLRRRTAPVMMVMIAITAALVLPPLAVLVQLSLTEANPDGSAGAMTLRHFADVLTQPSFYAATWNSIVFSLLSAALTLVIGTALAWVVERTNAPLKWLAYLTTIVSLGTPYLLFVAAWLFLFGRAGPMTDLYQYLTGSTRLMFNIYSMPGMVLVEGFLWTPLVFLMLTATFRTANAEMEAAARICGASVLSTFWRISLRLAGPAILAMGLFLVIRNLESFDVPVLIGMPSHINVLTTEVYFRVNQPPPDLGYIGAFSLLLIGLVFILLHVYGRISRSAERYATITGKGFRPRPLDLGRWRWAGAAFIFLNFVVLLLLPLAALVWMALMPFMGRVRLASLHLLSLRNFRAVFAQPGNMELALNTVLISACAATLVMALMLISGWLIARRRKGAAMLDQLTTIPLVFPGIVLGVAMMELAVRAPFPLYGTLWIIVLAFTVRYIPYGMRYAFAGAIQIHRELEEAAGASGAPWWQTLRAIVVPLLSPALFSGWIFIFLIAAKELSLAVLLSGPDSKTIAVAMYDLWGNGQGTELAAFGLMWSGIMTFIAAGCYVVSRRQGRSGIF